MVIKLKVVITKHTMYFAKPTVSRATSLRCKFFSASLNLLKVPCYDIYERLRRLSILDFYAREIDHNFKKDCAPHKRSFQEIRNKFHFLHLNVKRWCFNALE